MADLAKGVLSIDTHEEAAAVSGLLSTLMELLPRKEFDEWTRSTKVSISKDTYFVALKRLAKSADSEELRALKESLGDNAIFKVANVNDTLGALKGFVMMLRDVTFVIDFVSRNVNTFAPFTPEDLIGRSLLDYIHPSDHPKIHSMLARVPEERLPTELGGKRNPALVLGRRRHVHVLFNYKEQYHQVLIMGQYLRTADDKYVFLGFCRPTELKPIMELSFMEAIEDQYTTRHLLNGRIIYADQRLSQACGYLPNEVMGMPGLDFVYPRDIPWTSMAQRHMLATLKNGFTVYRLRCKNGSFISVQTRGFFEFDPQTNQPSTFVCINDVISDDKAAELLRKQREKFTPFIVKCHQQETARGKYKGSLNEFLLKFDQPDILQIPKKRQANALDCSTPATKRPLLALQHASGLEESFTEVAGSSNNSAGTSVRDSNSAGGGGDSRNSDPRTHLSNDQIPVSIKREVVELVSRTARHRNPSFQEILSPPSSLLERLSSTKTASSRIAEVDFNKTSTSHQEESSSQIFSRVAKITEEREKEELARLFSKFLSGESELEDDS